MRDGYQRTAQMKELFATLRTTHGGPAFLTRPDFTSLRRRVLEDGGVDDDEETYADRCAWVMRQLDDPYAAYLNPSQVRALHERFHGVVGVGLQVQTSRVGWWKRWKCALCPNMGHLDYNQESCRTRVTRVAAGSTAERAGIEVGDELLVVDGMPVTGLTESALMDSLNGPEGSKESYWLHCPTPSLPRCRAHTQSTRHVTPLPPRHSGPKL